MLVEYGLSPEIPGMEISETFIEEDLRYNPECPCLARSCPQHGFCKYCLQHHRALNPAVFPEDPDYDATGEYKINHNDPVCWRIPREEIATKEGYKR